MTPQITVCIPTIPPRRVLLLRALRSVFAQSLPPAAVAVAVDAAKEGAARTRNRALAQVQTEWVAFLDDDDELMPHHLEKLVACVEATGASLVFPWFTVVAGTDPFPQHFGRGWDIGPDNVADFRHFPITVLAKTDAIRAVGGFEDPPGEGQAADGYQAGEDRRCWERLVMAGTRIVHLPEKTWLYHHDSKNTSGRPDRW